MPNDDWKCAACGQSNNLDSNYCLVCLCPADASPEQVAQFLRPDTLEATANDTSQNSPPLTPVADLVTEQEATNPAPSNIHRFHFTGSGAEYFKIWIVNLCLTLATLGIYSAWAKVRRLQYFDRNTQIAGAVMNFHGNPMAILKGRLIAVLLLVAYHYAFGFSKIFGVVVISVLFVIMPWLLRNALRFRLRNTSYRGVRFDFTGHLSGAYMSYAPLLAIFLLPALAGALFPKEPIVLGSMLIVLYLSWPIIHASMKRFQQSYLAYGDLSASYSGSIFSLIKPYLVSFGFGIGLLIGMLILFFVSIGILSAIFHKDVNTSTTWMMVSGFGFGLLCAYTMYLIAGPFLQVRIWNLVWNNTQFPGFTIRSELKFSSFLWLQTINLVLTLLTLGLYRPFAVIRTYQYRLAHMSLTGSSFDLVTQSHHAQSVAASGDSAADLFDIDLSF